MALNFEIEPTKLRNGSFVVNGEGTYEFRGIVKAGSASVFSATAGAETDAIAANALGAGITVTAVTGATPATAFDYRNGELVVTAFPEIDRNNPTEHNVTVTYKYWDSEIQSAGIEAVASRIRESSPNSETPGAKREARYNRVLVEQRGINQGTDGNPNGKWRVLWGKDDGQIDTPLGSPLVFLQNAIIANPGQSITEIINGLTDPAQKATASVPNEEQGYIPYGAAPQIGRLNNTEIRVTTVKRVRILTSALGAI